jgi:integrase/recombinase XerD
MMEGSAMQKTIDAFLNWLVEEKGSTPNTIVAYRNDLGQFLGWLQAHTAVQAWTGVAEGDIRAYRDELQRRDYALTTVARKIAAVRSFFHYLLRTGVLDDDPTLKVTAGAPARPAPESLSGRAAQQLWDSVPGDTALDLRDRALVALIAGAGLKASQVTALDVGDVGLQPDQNTLRVEGRRGQVESKALAPEVAADLGRYVAEGRPALAGAESPAPSRRPLFLNARGGRLSRQGLWGVLKKRGEAAGSGQVVSPRSLRGTLED